MFAAEISLPSLNSKVLQKGLNLSEKIDEKDQHFLLWTSIMVIVTLSPVCI